MRRSIVIGAWLVALSGCGDTTPAPSCTLTSDCPTGQTCSLGRCIDDPAPGPMPRMDAGSPPADAGHSPVDAGPAPRPDSGVPREPDGGAPRVCLPFSCATLAAECGQPDDGCGETLNCGTCPPDRRCDGGRCICTPKSCEELGAECGSVGNGCGITIECGGCPGSDRCGTHTPNQCGCTPRPTTATEYLVFRRARSTSAGPGTLPWRDLQTAEVIDGKGASFTVYGSCDVIEEEREGCRCCGGEATQVGDSANLQLTNADLRSHLPAGAVIRGIEVRLTVRRTRDRVELSSLTLTGPSGGSTEGKRTISVGSDFRAFRFGGPEELWGRAWTAAALLDPSFGLNLRMRAAITCGAGTDGAACKRRRSAPVVDGAEVRVHYQPCR